MGADLAAQDQDSRAALPTEGREEGELSKLPLPSTNQQSWYKMVQAIGMLDYLLQPSKESENTESYSIIITAEDFIADS